MEKSTVIGKVYSVLSQVGGTVTDANGIVICTFEAGVTTYFSAPTQTVIVSDGDAYFTENFNPASAGGSSGGGSSVDLTGYATEDYVDSMAYSTWAYTKTSSTYRNIATNTSTVFMTNSKQMTWDTSVWNPDNAISELGRIVLYSTVEAAPSFELYASEDGEEWTLVDENVTYTGNEVLTTTRTGFTTVYMLSLAVTPSESLLGKHIRLVGDIELAVYYSGGVSTDVTGNVTDADVEQTSAVLLADFYKKATVASYVAEAVEAIDLPEVDLTGYATESYVTTAISSKADSSTLTSHINDTEAHLTSTEHAGLTELLEGGVQGNGILDYRQGVITDSANATLELSVSSVTEYDVSEFSSLTISSISIADAEDGKVNTAELWLTTGESTIATVGPDNVNWFNNDTTYKLSARTRYHINVRLEPDGSMVVYPECEYYEAPATDDEATITSVGVFFPTNSTSIYGRRFATYSDGTTKYGSYIDGTYTEATGLEYCTYLAADTDSTTYTLEKGTKNDFDNLFPWSAMKREVIEGQTMILVPKFAMRVLETEITYDSFDTNGVLVDQLAENGLLIEISVNSDPDSVIGDEDGDFRLSKAFMRPDNSYMDWYGVGAYEGTAENVNGVACLGSIAGNMPKVSATRAAFTALAKALNAVSDAYDDSSWNITTIWETQELMIPLMWVESACRSTQTAYGQGLAHRSAASVTGLADAINYYYPAGPLRSGNVASSTTGTNAVVYRGIENPWGNVWKCVNGLHCANNMEWNGTSGHWWIAQLSNDRTLMGEYSTEETLIAAGYGALGYAPKPTSGYVSTVGVGDISFLPTATSSAANANTYFADYIYTTTTAGYNTAYWGGYWKYGSYYGSVCWAVSIALGNSHAYSGARLSLAF